MFEGSFAKIVLYECAPVLFIVFAMIGIVCTGAVVVCLYEYLCELYKYKCGLYKYKIAPKKSMIVWGIFAIICWILVLLTDVYLV